MSGMPSEHAPLLIERSASRRVPVALWGSAVASVIRSSRRRSFASAYTRCDVVQRQHAVVISSYLTLVRRVGRRRPRHGQGPLPWNRIRVETARYRASAVGGPFQAPDGCPRGIRSNPIRFSFPDDSVRSPTLSDVSEALYDPRPTGVTRHSLSATAEAAESTMRSSARSVLRRL